VFLKGTNEGITNRAEDIGSKSLQDLKKLFLSWRRLVYNVAFLADLNLHKNLDLDAAFLADLD